MKKQILLFLLVISLAFNLAFIGMFIWHRTHAPIPFERPEFHDFKEHMRQKPGRIEADKQDFMDCRRQFMDYLREDEFNETVADSLRQETLNRQIKLETAFGKRLIEMRKNGEFNDKDFRRPPEDRLQRSKRRRK
ncbi:MAG: hypothetical protein P9X26_05480 [Candidatus Stygibacter frigidus]|nr:hypothetical protein [Candidatus Stygibacter frigidus]